MTLNAASDQTYQYFLQEAEELLQTMDDELQDLAASFSVQKVHNLMRAAHTLKGAAASVGLDSIKDTTHSLEDVFKALCHADTVISIELEGLIFEGYDCLKLLMSAQLAGAQVDEADILDRMTGVMTRLQDELGDRFGQEGHLPTSTDLGFDMTQSIFEAGVMQRLDSFEAALVDSDVEALRTLMETQAEVFVGLAESLDLPGFAEIALTTQEALAQSPEKVLEIADVVLADYRAAQVDVLAGDRTQGGTPSAALKQFATPEPESCYQSDAPQPIISIDLPLPPSVEDFSTEGFPTEDFSPEDFSPEDFFAEDASVEDSPTEGSPAEGSSDTVEDNWLLRLLKPPACSAEEGEQSELFIDEDYRTTASKIDDAGDVDCESLQLSIEELTIKELIDHAAERGDLSDFVPTQLSQLDLVDAQDTVQDEPLPEEDFNNETDLLELIPECLSEIHASADSSTIELPNLELPALESLDAEPLIVEPPVSNASVSDSVITEIPTTDNPKTDTSAFNLSIIELSDASFSDIVSDVILSDIEPPSVDIEEHTERPEDPLPDLSLLFTLDDDSDEPTESRQTEPDEPAVSTSLAPDASKPPEVVPVEPLPTKSHNSQSTLRITVERIEQLTQAMGELLTQQNKQSLYNEQTSLLVKQLLDRIALQQKQLDQHRLTTHSASTDRSLTVKQTSSSTSNQSASDLSLSQFDDLELDRYSDTQLLVQTFVNASVQQMESAEAIELFTRRSGQALDKQKRLLSSLRETLLEVRMLPLDNVFRRFPAAVKRLEAQHPKQVKLAISGKDVLVDRVIADKLYDPLLHLVRNAFDHGIEAAEQRQRQNKPATGTITIEALQQGRHLVINVKDDGQGLNFEKIRHRAVENGLVTANEADMLTAAQTTDLLFEPGFSTASEVSHLSGRGVGLDAVRAQVRSLQGQVTVSHQPKTGTCFTLQIPSSLTIAKLLLCQSQGRTYALIADAIEHILIPSAEQIRTWEGGKSITWKTNEEEHLIPVSVLSDVFHYASPLPESNLDTPLSASKAVISHPVILIRQKNSLIGLEVDRLLGEQELAINALSETITPPAYLYGSSILPDGQLTLVIDSVALAKIALEKNKSEQSSGSASLKIQIEPTPNKPAFQQKLALVIDDSITVRNSSTEALQSAGYQVIQARDGAEALQQLHRYPNVDVIVCDVEMPGMNGFEFLKARQQVPAFAAIPTVMLTSRDGSKHRLLARELGAIAYLTKPYLAPQLLKTVAAAMETAPDRSLIVAGKPK